MSLTNKLIQMDILYPKVQVTGVGTSTDLTDLDSSNSLVLKCGSDITADRDLTFVTGDSNRSLTLSADVELDQNVTSTSSPTFADLNMVEAAPILTIHNTTEEDVDGGRPGIVSFVGEQSGGEITTLAQIKASHDGIADDQKGKIEFFVNDGDDDNSPSVSPLVLSSDGTATFKNTGLHIQDTNASHDLIIKPGSDLTADKTLTITTGDADRTLTLSGNLTVESASIINQDLSTDADVTFNSVTVPTITFDNTGLHILDTNASHDLIIAPGSDLSEDRTLTITTGDADRTLTLSGNVSLNQNLLTTSSPTFAAETLTHSAPTITSINTTAEDSDGGRLSEVIFKGTQSGSELTTLAKIKAYHDGAADDEKGALEILVNDGNDGNTPSKSGVKVLSDGTVIVPALKVGNVAGGNYAELTANGTFYSYGTGTYWKDLYPTSVTLGSGANAPSFTAYNGNLRAYEFVGTGVTLKELNLGWQLNHDAVSSGTVTIKPHIHLYIPDNVAGGTIKFYCEYTWTSIDETGVIATTTISGTVTRGANAGINNNKILAFNSNVVSKVDPGLSSIFMCRIYRNPADGADDFGASVWLKSADIHYLANSDGSEDELVK